MHARNARQRIWLVHITCQMTALRGSSLRAHGTGWLAAFLLTWMTMVVSSAATEVTRTTGRIGEGTPWESAYYVIDSHEPGPTVMIVGGMHGNEPSGVVAAEQISHWTIQRGVLVVLPCANRQGREANTRYLVETDRATRDLNRNFPRVSEPSCRGEIAESIWELTTDWEPDWVLDLHEGYEFNISHEPPEGESKSVGTSIIFRRSDSLDPLVDRMLTSINRGISDTDRQFVPLGGGPVLGGWVAACIDQFGADGMILETTFKDQALSLRARQHRILVNEVLRWVGVIEVDQSNVMTDTRESNKVQVALFDGPGASAAGVRRLKSQIGDHEDLSVQLIGPGDVRDGVLDQFDAVVFPGGSGSAQGRALGDDGRGAVREFISEGGGCVGICAGAYLCSAFYSWSLKVIDSAVYTGAVEIEGVGRKQMWYRGGPTDVDMELTEQGLQFFDDIDAKTSVRFQNGPIISPMNDPLLPDYQVLAYFRSENALYPPQVGTMINTPAIVTGEFGEGRVVSISPHPEATEGLETMILQSIEWSVANSGIVAVSPND